jgi:ribosomal protein S18 acetylase RimI-like enzyme
VKAAEVSLRALTRSDEPFLLEMLREADRWRLPPDAPRPPMTEILADPHVRLYVEGWGRPGDDGVIAHAGGEPVGACWLRLFSAESHGWGFISADVPELSIAVAPHCRRRGIGARLLAAVLIRAKQSGHGAVSLSVMPENSRARELYEWAGFRKVALLDGSWIMEAKLGPDVATDR